MCKIFFKNISFKNILFYTLFCFSISIIITFIAIHYRNFKQDFIGLFRETFLTSYTIKHFGNKYNNDKKIMIVSHYALGKKFIDKIIKNHETYAEKHGYDYWFRGGIIDSGFISFTSKDSKNRLSILLGLYWQKLIAVKQAMSILDQHNKPKYDWIMWIDGDAVFTDMDKSLEQLMLEINIQDKDYFIIAKDMYCCNALTEFYVWLNTGVFLIRNNKNGKQLIEDIMDSNNLYKDRFLPEQDAIQEYVFGLVKRVNNSMTIVEKYNPYKHRDKIDPIVGIKVLTPELLNSGYSLGISYWKANNFISHFISSSKIYINDFLTCFNNSQDKSECEYLNLFNNNEKN